MSTQTSEHHLAMEAFAKHMPGADPVSIGAQRFLDMLRPLEGVSAEFDATADVTKRRNERDALIAGFPDKFRSLTGAFPSDDQVNEFANGVEKSIDAQIYDAALAAWRAHAETGKTLAAHEAEAQTPLKEPTAAEIAGARERLKGLTARRVVDIYRDSDDAHPIVYLLEQIADDKNWDAIALSGDPVARLDIMKAIKERRQSRIPAWVRAARNRHRELMPATRDVALRLILNGQKIVRRNGNVRRYAGGRV